MRPKHTNTRMQFDTHLGRAQWQVDLWHHDARSAGQQAHQLARVGDLHIEICVCFACTLFNCVLRVLECVHVSSDLPPPCTQVLPASPPAVRTAQHHPASVTRRVPPGQVSPDGCNPGHSPSSSYSLWCSSL